LIVRSTLNFSQSNVKSFQVDTFSSYSMAIEFTFRSAPANQNRNSLQQTFTDSDISFCPHLPFQTINQLSLLMQIYH